VTRFGAARLWKARSVGLRHLLIRDAPSRQPFPPPADGWRSPTDRSEPSDPRPATRDPGLEDLARRLAARLQPPPAALLQPTGPLEWPAAFFPYQRDGIRALLSSEHLLLGDDMGLGKTIQAIAALRLLFFRREIERALVVVPASLLEQWCREFALWAPELRVMAVAGPPEDRLWQWQYRAHVTLTSYDTLRADDTGTPACGPCREPWSVVLLDEAQRIKNRATDIARSCKRLPRHRSWALTGTPLENRVDDVISILEFVTGSLSAASPSPLLPFSPSSASPPAVRAALGEFQLRRRKVDVLRDLPPKIATELLLPLNAAQRRAYDRAEQEGLVALRELGEVRIENVLALITRLKQICNFAPLGNASAKMEDLSGRLEELTAAGHKALVFTQYAGDEGGARRIAERLRRFSPLLYTGQIEPHQRSRIVQRFQEEDARAVLVLSLRAGGLGLNLQRASYVFHFDRWWNPAVERQAEDRTHRLGQTQPVHVYRYLMADTIEERIDALLKEKTQLFEQIVDATSLDLRRLLDQRDLFGLVGLDLPGDPPRDPSGLALERRVADLLSRQGYHVEHVGHARDGGIDVIAEKSDAVGAPLRLFIQCKDTRHPVGLEAVRGLNGALPPGDRSITGVLVSPAGFTPEARSFAFARHLQLWDAAKLEALERGGA
jgi:SNF2 family DNA or RNA helicase